MTPFDDDLMSHVFDKNIEATELILRIILEDDISVTSVEGQAVYHIDRYVRETGQPFEDGSHIIYVNGSYKGENEIARLMEDFHQKDPENMHYSALAEGVETF